MSFSAMVYRILIASPSDLSAERAAIKDTINLWNIQHAEHYRLIFLPTMWETSTIPKVGGRPQEIINTQIVDKSDLLIGVFWTRIGSPTGIAESGTIEEIQRFIDSNKQASLYFSNKPIPQAEFNVEQFTKLQEFKQKMLDQGLMGDFTSIEELERKIDHLLSEIAKEKGGEGYKVESVQAIRKPNFKILLNEMEQLELKKPTAHYNREVHDYIDYDDIDEHLQKYLTREEVDEYNKSIPQQERIEKYNEELRIYHLVTNHLSNLTVSIENTGNLKANNILVDLTFPPEVLVIKEGSSDEWEKPERPSDFPINPLVKAHKQYKRDLVNKISPLAGISNFQLSNPQLFNTPFSTGSLVRKIMSATNSGHYVWVDDNEVTIKVESLLHTRRRIIDEDIEIVALKNGEYTIDVEIISEELEEPICFSIPLIVTR